MDMCDEFMVNKLIKVIFVGDFNIVLCEDDVWDYKKFLKVVSYILIEVEYLVEV